MNLQIKDSTMSYQDTLILRAILFFGIFFFHAGWAFGFGFPDIGHLCVAGFFFMSGFGLEYSRRNKANYLKTFLQKRVMGLMIQYWIIMLVSALAWAVVHLSADNVLPDVERMFFGSPHWYVAELVVFYIIFFLTGFMGSERTRSVALAIVCTAAMFLMSDYFGSPLYYASGASFVLGVLWAQYSAEVRQSFERHGLGILIVCFAILALTTRSSSSTLDFVVTSVGGMAFCIILWAVCSIKSRYLVPVMSMASILMVIVSMASDFADEGATMLLLASICGLLMCPGRHRDILAFIGTMSYPLYLLHYPTFNYFYPGLIDEFYFPMIASLAIALVLSYLAQSLCDRVIGRYNSLFEDGTST